MDVTQFRLIVSDFPAMFRFYRDVLGLRPQFDEPHDPPGPYAAFKPDLGSTIALHDRADLVGVVPDLAPAGGDRALLALRVDDLADYLGLLRGRGCQVGEPVEQGGRLRCAYLRDPEGNLIEVQQWLATRSGAAIPPAS